MKCSKCNKEILKDSNYCPFCGEDLYNPESSKEEKDIVNANVWRPDNNRSYNSDNVLSLGVLAFILSFFVGSFLSVGIIGFSIFLIVKGLKIHKKEKNSKNSWGLILTSLALLLSTLNLSGYVMQEMKIRKSYERYSEELEIEIPKIYPSHYYEDIDIELISQYDYNFTNIVYDLSAAQAGEFEEKISTDPRWVTSSFNEEFMSKFYNDLDIENFDAYLCFDRLTDTFVLPEDYSDYDYVLVLYSSSDQQIIIYDISQRD